jgi:polar amino acid transport system ATP-binding protein
MLNSQNDSRATAAMVDEKPLIEAVDVHKSFGSHRVLKGCSLSVAQRQTVVIIGPSGSGKSTFLRCLNLLEPIDSGSIFFDGQQLTGPTTQPHLIRQKMGMVFQNFELFRHLSAVENIMLAPTKVLGVGRLDAHDLALDLLRKVHIPEKADSYPDELSGGQQQRVAIARALAMRPKVVLYDEPTSALDPEMIREVLDVMADLSAEGMTSVVVTHEMGFARRAADRIIFMDEGNIIENADSETFFEGSVTERTQRFLSQILH